MRYADIKKASEEEGQNQTSTTNINYIKKFKSVLKNKQFNNKVKIASDKTENKKKITCNLPDHNDYSPVHNKAW